MTAGTRREARMLRAGPQRSTPSILVVCTGNIIRSAFIAGMLRTAFARSGVDGVDVHSAGTAAAVGHRAILRAREVARAHGIDIEEHRARLLTESTLTNATTILCAASEHRRSVLRMTPGKVRATFTVRELARLVAPLDAGTLPPDPAARWARMETLAAEARRKNSHPARPGDDDIIDPIGADDAVWARFERDAVEATTTILGVLLPHFVAAAPLAERRS